LDGFALKIRCHAHFGKLAHSFPALLPSLTAGDHADPSVEQSPSFFQQRIFIQKVA
jgi:hypothetical protein